MVATAARQPGHRPETIRTRLARFIPRGAAAAWSAGWLSQTERAAEASSDDELNVAEHFGCYAAAISHALAKAEMAPARLRLHADAKEAPDASLQVITLEVHAAIVHSEIDVNLFDTLVRRAEPTCPVWKELIAAGRLRVIPLVDDAPVEHAAPSLVPTSSERAATQSWTVSRQINIPAWLSRRAAVLVVAAGGLLVLIPHALSL